MRGKYEAAFLLPLGAAKHLDEDGWEFNSESFISEQIKQKFMDELNLKYSETSLATAYYLNDFVQASVFYDETEKSIEHIYFQVYEGQLDHLKKAFLDSGLDSSFELFIPKEENIL